MAGTTQSRVEWGKPRSRPPTGVSDIMALCGKDEIPLNAAFLTAVAGPRYQLNHVLSARQKPARATG
jgi:hypothetical protein